MIEVIPYTYDRDEYGYTNGTPDPRKVIARKGDIVVSHGVCTETGHNVCLPCDPWHEFTREHCVRFPDGWYLKA